MQFNTFFIPVGDDGRAQDELNSFLRSQRVLAVEKAFVETGWSFCVEWLEGGKPSFQKKGKVDYREVLTPEQFTAFSRLREKRKELAQRDGVQLYAVMTNEQLAEMVRLEIKSSDALHQISGLGSARIEKYGEEFMSL